MLQVVPNCSLPLFNRSRLAHQLARNCKKYRGGSTKSASAPPRGGAREPEVNSLMFLQNRVNDLSELTETSCGIQYAHAVVVVMFKEEDIEISVARSERDL